MTFSIHTSILDVKIKTSSKSKYLTIAYTLKNIVKDITCRYQIIQILICWIANASFLSHSLKSDVLNTS